MNVNPIRFYAMLALALLAGLIIWHEIDTRDDKIMRSVYAVCNYTRTTDAKETTCGMVQDETNTEFLCKDNNNSKSNVCWVEFK